MAKLLQIGNRVIDVNSVVAAERQSGNLKVYLAGIRAPFRFSAGDAEVVWAAIEEELASALPEDDLTQFALMELPMGEGVAAD